MIVKAGEEEEEEKKNKKSNHWFFAVGISSTQETVKTAGGIVCVFLCHVLCVCQLLCCCHLKRKREADAFKPSGIQWHKDAHVKCLPLIWIHVKMPPLSSRAM